MDFDLFKKCINQIVISGIKDIRLTPMAGEIFMDPNWKEKLDYIESIKEIESYEFFTNFTVINDIEYLSTLKKLNSITISIYGNNLDSFLELTNSKKIYYDQLIKNLRILKDIKIKNLKIVIKSKLDYFDNYLKGELFQILYNFKGNIVQYKELDNFNGLSNNLNFDNLKTINNINCNVLETKNIILWNGDFNLCGCRDIFQKSTIGNIKNTPLKELLESNDYEIMKQNKLIICKDCSGIYS
jgi:hypothetical protein